MILGGSMDEFLGRWYGPPAREPSPPPAAAPLALRQWWAYESAWDTPLTVLNYVLPPADLYRDNDRTVFYVENQGVWLWAYGEGSDPDVYGRENKPGVEWEP